MKFMTFVTCSLLTTASAFADFYVKDGKVMAEVRHYTKGDKTIVLMDMIHVAPKSFYKDVNKRLKTLQRSSNPVVLQEGVRHCEVAGDVTYIPGPSADFAALTKLYNSRVEFDVASAEAALAAAGFGKRSCSQGSSNAQPGFIDRFSSRFSMYGLIAGIGFVRSQGSVKVYPKGMKLESGDIATARFESPISKALAGSVVECMLSLKAEGGCVPFKAWSTTVEGKKLTDEVIMERRNDVLLAATFNALGIQSRYGDDYNFQASASTNNNTVILPWGAAHMPGGLVKAIEEMGFKKVVDSGIQYTDCARVRRNILLNQILADDANVKAGCNL